VRARPNRCLPPMWLPFFGNRMGIVKQLYSPVVDPEDFDLHHCFPTTTVVAALIGDTREFQPRAGGVGLSLQDGANRAMGECLERYASLAYDGGGRIVSSYANLERLGKRSVSFEMLTLFSREQLQAQGFSYAEFTESTQVGWFEGIDLTNGAALYVPGQLLSLGYAPSADEISPCFYATSSGCALATTAEGALLGGLLECIERDAMVMRWYARVAPPRLNFSVDELLPRTLGLPGKALEICFFDMTVDGDVPVVGVTCIERTSRPCFFVIGCAAALDTVTAARKALLEVGQGRPFIKFLANRDNAPNDGDTFNGFDSNARFYAEPTNGRYVEWFTQNASVSSRSIRPAPNSNDPTELFGLLLDRCAATGLTPIAFDMTTPELREHGLFVCRVFVPELVPLCVPAAPFFGHPRLARYIAEAKRAGIAASVPAWVPHPFP
jgi:ribosomal protein S12 methylthiotransferase accessory factor